MNLNIGSLVAQVAQLINGVNANINNLNNNIQITNTNINNNIQIANNNINDQFALLTAQNANLHILSFNHLLTGGLGYRPLVKEVIRPNS